MKNLISLLLLAIITTNVQGQYFQRLYGTTGDEKLNDGHNFSQGGHFFVAPSPDHSYELTATRTDWQGEFGGGSPYFNNKYKLYEVISPITPSLQIQEVHSTEMFPFNTFAIAGSYINGVIPSSGFKGLFYTVLNADGTVSPTTKRYSANANDMHVQKIIRSEYNPNYLYICGYITETAAGCTNCRTVFVLKIDNTGNISWSAKYAMAYGSGSETPYDIIESPFEDVNHSHEVIVVGKQTKPNAAGGLDDDAFLLRIDNATGTPNGNVQFYGSAQSDDVFTCIKPSFNPKVDPYPGAECGFVLGGTVNKPALGSNTDFWFLAMKKDGTVSWSKKYNYNGPSGASGANEDYCNDIIERRNTDKTQAPFEYYLAGYTNDGFFGGEDIMVIKTNEHGDAVNNGQFTYGTKGDEKCIRIDFSNNCYDGLSLFGYSNRTPQPSPPLGGFDNLLIKTKFDGVTTCDYDITDPLPSYGPRQLQDLGLDATYNIYDDYNMYADFISPINDETICSGSLDSPPKMVAHWNFTGGNLVDRINGLIGTIHGGVTGTAGSTTFANDAYHFDGTTGYIVVPPDPILDLESWTIKAIVRPEGFYDSIDQGNAIVWRGPQHDDHSAHYDLEIFDNGWDNDHFIFTPDKEVFAGSPGGTQPTAPPFPSGLGWPTTDWAHLIDPGNPPSPLNPFVQLNNWYCVWISYDAVNERLDLYVNSQHVFSKYYPNRHRPWHNDSLFIGSSGIFNPPNPIGYPFFFNGIIDDIAIYDGPLLNPCLISCTATEEADGGWDPYGPMPAAVTNKTNAVNNISVYPNPANDKLFVKGIKDANYEIKSIDGRKVLKGTVSASKAIDINGLASGVYILNITENGTTQNLKFTKQ